LARSWALSVSEGAADVAAAQYQFNRNLIRSADRALSQSDDDQK
jgi:hypothetical protein